MTFEECGNLNWILLQVTGSERWSCNTATQIRLALILCAKRSSQSTAAAATSTVRKSWWPPLHTEPEDARLSRNEHEHEPSRTRYATTYTVLRSRTFDDGSRTGSTTAASTSYGATERCCRKLGGDNHIHRFDCRRHNGRFHEAAAIREPLCFV